MDKKSQHKKSKKTWQLNNAGGVQASVLISIGAASRLTSRALKAGMRPLDYMASILEQTAQEAK